MIKETSGDCFERARALEQQLTFHKTEEYYEKKHIKFGPSQKTTLGLVGNDGMYTNLAMYYQNNAFIL